MLMKIHLLETQVIRGEEKPKMNVLKYAFEHKLLVQLKNLLSDKENGCILLAVGSPL